MIYKFLLISDEVDDFMREISIDSDATFLELNNAILDSVNYAKDQITSFFICEDDWEKKTEVTLMEMDANSEDDSWIMEKTALSDLIEDEKQRVLFVFDNLTERSFFMELREIVTGKNLDKPVCTKSVGQPPVQLLDIGDFETGSTVSDLDENFYGDETYDPSELDVDGYDDLDMSDDNFTDRGF